MLTSLLHRFEAALLSEKNPPAAGLEGRIRDALYHYPSLRDLPVRKEGDAMLPAEREQFLLAPSHNRIVMPLIHTWFDVAVFLTYLDHSLHFGGSIVGDSEPLEFALPKRLIHSFCRLFERGLTIRYV